VKRLMESRGGVELGKLSSDLRQLTEIWARSVVAVESQRLRRADFVGL
jgi:hypothetical protein